jgi:general L-amino acid transport system substrate-binding protein
MKLTNVLAAFAVAAGIQIATESAGHAQSSGSATIDAIRQRGVLLCGVDGNVAGFSLPDSKGVMRGIDADYCRAVAAAVLGDVNKVKFVLTGGAARFPSLQTGVVDMMSQQTTWTLTRESSLGLMFTGIYFYDGTGFVVKSASGIKSAKEMDGATVCVQTGTTTELVVTDYFRRNNMKFTPVLIENLDAINAAFLSGRCDARAGDSSALAGFRMSQGDHAGELTILPEIISKEPLGPAVRKGDDKWFDVVRWTGFALIIAEENGITSENVDSFANSTSPDVRRLLGIDGEFGKTLGLDNKWAYNVIKQVGNYQEIWDRDMAPLGIQRGLNNLWTKGGLLYAPPNR